MSDEPLMTRLVTVARQLEGVDVPEIAALIREAIMEITRLRLEAEGLKERHSHLVGQWP